MSYRNKAQQREYQRLWMKNRRDTYIQKLGGKCSKCNSIDCLEFHHKNPATKISHNIWSWSIKRLEEELLKCELLCHNCHWDQTRIDFNYNNYICGTSLAYDKGNCRCVLCRAANTKRRADYRFRTGKR